MASRVPRRDLGDSCGLAVNMARMDGAGVSARPVTTVSREATATLCRASDTMTRREAASPLPRVPAGPILMVVSASGFTDGGSRAVSRHAIRVATYNIHRGRGLDGRVSLKRIADVLQQIDADVIGVQEVYEAQAELLARELAMQLVTGITVHRPDGAYGNAILTRLALRGVATFDLSVRAREARGGIRADLAVQDQTLHVFNVHLGLRGRERAEQVKWLVERHILWDDRTGPRVVVGDLNEWVPPGRVGRALRREFTSLRLRRTHPALLPLWALDRIYWDHAVHGESLRVHQTRVARVASDHLPLVASLRLRATAPG
jgi:endonuclease/exonuclease/phosphatase family metal-dependent hydrolase